MNHSVYMNINCRNKNNGRTGAVNKALNEKSGHTGYSDGFLEFVHWASSVIKNVFEYAKSVEITDWAERYLIWRDL